MPKDKKRIAMFWTHHAQPLTHYKLQQLALGPLSRAWVPVAPSTDDKENNPHKNVSHYENK